MATNPFLNWERENRQKYNFTKKKIDLFDFTSFFAWIFFNFLARCVGLELTQKSLASMTIAICSSLII